MPESETNTFFIKNKDNLVIPDKLHEIMKAKGKNVLAIATRGGSKILLFPVDAEKGIYTKIKIKIEFRLDDVFFIELKKQLDKFKIKTLYTTGVCVKAEECYWEGIFSNSNEFDKKSFENALSQINTVESVFVKFINSSN